MKSRWLWPSKVAALVLLNGLSWTGLALAQDFDQASCDEFLHPKRVVQGQEVGPESCLMQETDVEFEGHTWRRLDIGLSGTVEGYLPKTGYYINYFTSAPDLVFPQGGNPGPIYFAIGRYDRNKGSSMTLLYPLERSVWNGKLWVTVHGRGRSFKRGNLKAWNKNLDRQNPLGDISSFERLMLEKGYAVAKTRRSSDTLGGDVEVTLEDGTQYPEKNLNDNAQVILDFTAVARKALERRLGQAPTQAYVYGHSAGGRIGRSINYVPGLNIGPDGKPFIDGILSDDSATGLWLPIVMKNGKDVLLATEQERQRFVPQIDVTHQMYNRETPGERPEWISTNYLQNKRSNAKILRDKGLSDRHTMYEVRSISHSGGGREVDGVVHMLNLALMMDKFIDILDTWVDKGTPPPPIRSDWVELGDLDGDGIIENPALSFPDVACPLGIYHQYPPGRGGPGSTFLATFTGSDELEPLDSRGVFIDMNNNGIRDHRETPTQAWRRLGLLRENETLTQEKYGACVYDAVERLRKDGFFTSKTAQWYVENAKKVSLNP